jgi:hypothetical protein
MVTHTKMNSLLDLTRDELLAFPQMRWAHTEAAVVTEIYLISNDATHESGFPQWTVVCLSEYGPYRFIDCSDALAYDRRFLLMKPVTYMRWMSPQ